MKPAIYIAYHGSDTGGVFSYTIAVVKILSRNKDVEEILLIHSPEQKPLLDDLLIGIPKVILVVTKIKSRFLTKHLWNISMALLTFKNVSEEIPLIVKKISNLLNPFNYFINKIKCDIVHVPFQFSPFYKANKPIVITLHDLQEYHFPEFFSPQTRIDRAIRFKMAIDYTNIIVSFNHVKNDILKYFQVKEPDKVAVCSILGSDWVVTKDSDNFQILQEKYLIPDNFILYPAQPWKHKNHISLIKALNILKSEGKNIHLICTGELNNNFQSLQDEIDKLGMKENVTFLGLVQSSELVCLYKNTKLVVIPTLYEAGSGPLFEAMCHHVPVICSNVTSLPETIGSSEFVFDPLNIINMAHLIDKAYFDDDFRNKNISQTAHQLNIMLNSDLSVDFINTYNNIIKKYNSF